MVYSHFLITVDIIVCNQYDKGKIGKIYIYGGLRRSDITPYFLTFLYHTFAILTVDYTDELVSYYLSIHI